MEVGIDESNAMHK